jgi:hypothetical protein
MARHADAERSMQTLALGLLLALGKVLTTLQFFTVPGDNCVSHTFVLEPRGCPRSWPPAVSAHFLDTLTVDPDPLRTDSTVTDTRVRAR